VDSVDVQDLTPHFNMKTNTNQAITHLVSLTSWAESMPSALPRYFENIGFILQYMLGPRQGSFFGVRIRF
jgi:hypothetical protein